MTRVLRLACPILSVSLLVSGTVLGHREWLTAGSLVFGAVWILGLVRCWSWMPTLGLFAVFGMAATGLVLHVPVFLMLISALFGFLAWDLAEFVARLRMAAPQDDTSRLERVHLRWMGAMVVASSLLCTLALLIRVKLSFEWLVFLVFLSLWGFGQSLNWFRRQGR